MPDLGRSAKMRSVYYISPLLTFIVSCTPYEPSTPRSGDDIIAETYSGVVNQIKDLSNTGQLDSWVSSNPQPFLIDSLSDLDTALGYFGELPETQIQSIKSEFTKSSAFYHFGYDGDFSVLVAFDQRGRQTYIYPTSMAPSN